MSRPHPYAGQRVALATKHAKDQAIAPALARSPGLQVIVPSGVDTDQLGTFTGEIERPAPPRATALMKAHLAVEATGVPRGLASEGAFGPHPQLFFVPGGIELLALVDLELGTEVVEGCLSERTNFAHTTSTDLDQQTRDFLAHVGFPAHALVVRPNAAEPAGPLAKGIQDPTELARAIERCRRASHDGLARIETDMRAHLNPTRMREIARLAQRLALRLDALCPDCHAPGYGLLDTQRGLPCSACQTATDLVAVEIHGCARCPSRDHRPRSDGLLAADPGHCPYCNP